MTLPQVNDFMQVTMPNFPNAVCADVDPEIFFPDESSPNLYDLIWKAKEFCFTCKHRVACADFAIKENISDGVWGGMSAEERQRGSVKKFKPRSDLGEKSLMLRNEGLKMREIAAMLDSTPTAVSKAIARHLQTIQVAS